MFVIDTALRDKRNRGQKLVTLKRNMTLRRTQDVQQLDYRL